jgi:hypothetical protein
VGKLWRAAGYPVLLIGGRIMPARIELLQEGKTIIVHVSGKLTADNYLQFTPPIEAAIQQHGKLRRAVVMTDFHGWEVAALWQDLKFDLKHFRDVERLALVGDRAWERGMAAFCKPFTTAAIQFF